MAILPDSKLARVEFFEAHIAAWVTGAGTNSIGLSVAQTTALNTEITAARAAYDAMIIARDAAKSATQAFYNAEAEMSELGSALIATIKAFAEATANPNVYVLAQIPPPATPSSAGAPTNPTDLGAFLENDGSVTLTWKGSLSHGQCFSIWRQLHGTSEWAPVGFLRAKKFTDNSVPQGIVAATYQIKAHRGTQISAGSEPVTVLFGSQLQLAA